MMKNRNSEREMVRRVLAHADAFDSADAPIAQSNGQDLSLAKSMGNPNFKAQFDMSFLLRYFTVASGVFTSIEPTALASSLKNFLSVFIFGHTDFSGGFSKLKSQYPLQNWVYGNPFIYGKDNGTTAFGDLDATGTADLQIGDLVVPVTATTGGTNYVGLVIVRCTQVAYGTLLDSLSSDTFNINMLRYAISQVAQQVQYQNQIGIFDQTLFGKFFADYVSPNSFKLPEQQQTGIIDVPIKKLIDKNSSFAMQVSYLATDFSWSVFVSNVSKLR